MNDLAATIPNAQFRNFEMENMLTLNAGAHEEAWLRLADWKQPFFPL